MAPDEPNFKNWLKTHPKVLNAQNKYEIKLLICFKKVISVFMFSDPKYQTKCHFLALKDRHSQYSQLWTINAQRSIEEHKIPAILSLSGLNHYIYISLKVSYHAFHKVSISHGRNTRKIPDQVFQYPIIPDWLNI